jgi:hypothetical protein
MRFGSMATKPARNRLDTAVPKPDQARRLHEGEKQALDLAEQAEHSHGEEREDLQREAKKAAENRKH